jgi:peptidoglycan L-alanyl-D-glutamate endopeptidase CwlK
MLPASHFGLRDMQRLHGVHPSLVARLDHVFGLQASLQRRMFVVQGVRTAAQQQALYAQGRTLPGKIVTMRDGIVHPSNHQPHADGLGHAVDCAFAGVHDPFADTLPWEAFGLLIEAEGLIWGGRWSHPVDCPHAELA